MSVSQRINNLNQRVTSTAATVAGAVLSVATLVALLALGWYEYREIIESDLERAEMQARILEDHATRSFGSVSVLMTSLDSQIDPSSLLQAHGRTDANLTQALVALPSVRSLSVLDTNGTILASSEPRQVGSQVALAQLGPLPAPGKEIIGSYVAGRNLPLLLKTGAKPATMPGVGFIPVLRALGSAPLYMVALVNPDSLSSFQSLTLNDSTKSAYLLSYQGTVLAASGARSLAPGSQMGTHHVFQAYLPRTEHASYVGAGAEPERTLVAFRLSRTRPLVVLVEQAHQVSVAHWFDTMRWFGAAALVTVVFLAGMTTVVHRSLRARESALRLLDGARLDLVRREQDLRVLLRSLQELVFRTDAHGVLTFVNERWVALRGEQVAQALSRPLTAVVEPDDSTVIEALFSRQSGAGVRTASARVRSVNGKLHRFDFAVVALTTGDTITGFAGSAVDVTERFAAEQALQHQLGFVAQLLESSPLPVATLDNTGRYTTVNRAWEVFMGRSRDRVIGRRRTSFMSAEEAATQAEHDAEVWRSGGTLSYEGQLRHRDGSRRDVIVTKVVVEGGEATPARLLSTMMDVSEFREAERATRQARDAAEDASRAKSEFIANISHELRTPLQSILGFSELGIMRGTQHPKLHAMFTDIHGSGTRMLALVNDLLDVAKIESAVGAINLERADLRGLVHNVLRELGPLLAARHQHVVAELGDQALIAKVDPVRFAQVIRNVMANAIKFSPMGTSIKLWASITSEDRILIGVRDHGAGIPPDELEKIFEAFVQSSTSKDGSGGTGLGLAICRKILAAHDGSISATNMADGGAEFVIDLPARHYLDRDSTF